MSIEILDFKLEAFEGPLDLLLHLIDKNKIDIYDIPIVEITEQYMEYVAEMERLDLDATSEFLVMAATLIQIKSKLLLPPEVNEEGEEEDPREELVQRLLEYKMFKMASIELRDKSVDAAKHFYHSQDIPSEVSKYKHPVDVDALFRDVTLEQLNRIFTDVMRRREDRIDPIRSKFGNIEKEETVSVGDKMILIHEKIHGLRKINFRTLLEVQPTKQEVIVTFLAVLELMKTGKIMISQEHIFGDIMIDSAE
ncbi:MAG: segregation and condensation protein A [Lachnospiraceae bacterium]